MADTLRVKRRASPGSVGAPASLANAELAYNENDHTLYIGEGTGGAGGSATVIVPVGGSGMGSGVLPLMDGTASAGTGNTWTRYDHVHPTDTSRAPLTSPNFGGTPTAPTPANGTNTTQLATAQFVLATRIDQLAAPNIDVPWASHKITGLLDPTNPQDACTKNYADSVAQGLDAKPSCKAATSGANITLSGAQTIDGIALVAGDRCLVKDQTATATNGIYVVSATAWTRALDMDTWAEVPDAFSFIEQGTANADSGWLCTSDQGGTLGTTAITWVQFSGAGQITAGSGLNKTGNTISAVPTAGRIAIGASIDIDATYVGQTSIITLGTITTGTWNGSTIQVARGGTGATTLTGYVIGNGTGAMTASATIPNSAITGLGTMSIQNATAVAITGGTIDGIVFDGGTF